MAKLEGFEVKVRVNNAAFRVKRVERDDTVVDLEIGDSEDGRFEDHTGGRKSAKLTLENATLDLNDNPFAAPFILTAGSLASVKIYWGGLLDDFDDFPVCLVTSGKVAADVAQLQPATITLVSKGDYTLAGEPV